MLDVLNGVKTLHLKKRGEYMENNANKFRESIKHKERSINDLALFMFNRVDEKESLYCLLLGARSL